MIIYWYSLRKVFHPESCYIKLLDKNYVTSSNTLQKSRHLKLSYPQSTTENIITTDVHENLFNKILKHLFVLYRKNPVIRKC